MSWADCLVVRALAWGIRNQSAGQTRAIFDERYGDEPEEWRREIWSLAAERAERKSHDHV